MLDGWPLATYVSHKSTKNRAGTQTTTSLPFILLDHGANINEPILVPSNQLLKPTAIMSSAFIRVCSICMLVASYPSSFHVYSFQFQQQPSASSQSSQQRSRIKTTQLSSSSSSSSIVQPNESSTIGTVGSGYLPILIAKLAAHRRHGKSWIICE